MTQIAVALSMIGVLLAPMGGIKTTKDCHIIRCDENFGEDLDWNNSQDDDGDTSTSQDDSGDGPNLPPPTECTPRDPQPARPDIAAFPLPASELVHSAGSGPVVVGMDTEWEWRGPQTVSWRQPSRPGVREDCSPVHGEPTEFTASLSLVAFEFEQGERKRYFTDDGRVTHRYTTIPRDEGEEQFTVCVYVGYEIPGEGFATLQLVEEFDHDVVEIRSTLIE